MRLGRRLLSTVLISFSLVIVVIVIMGRNFTIRGFSDGFFVVGLSMFFFALITLTHAADFFSTTSFVFKSIFRRGTNQVGSYHQYLERRNVNYDSVAGLIRLSVSLIYLFIAWFLVA